MAEDLATLQTRLEEARAALHQLLTGQITVSVSYDGRSVTYSQSSVGKLRAYIRELERKIDPATATRRRAIGVRYV